MMRVVSLLLVSLLLSVVSAQEGGGGSQPPQEERKTGMPVEEYAAVLQAQLERLKGEWGESPATLAKAHVRLERILSSETLAEIDKMDSEDRMIRYHHGLGTGMRNVWGLWADSALAKHMRGLGFTHPDNMSGVILNTFWCKRHGRDFRLAERAASAKRAREIERMRQEEEDNRVRAAKVAMRNMMMGLRFEKREIPVVRMPDRGEYSARARSLAPFRDGVFFSRYGMRRGSNTPFVTPGYYFDPADRKIHKIQVAEIDSILSAVVIGKEAWFVGTTYGKAVLVGISDQDRAVVPLPKKGSPPPQLGVDGQSLLAVYPWSIYRLTDRRWTLVHSGDVRLPHSGPPPQRYGNKVFFRDEGRLESDKRLWWLTLGEQPRLSALDEDIGLVGPYGPHWQNSFSYCVTSNGDLWACVGSGLVTQALLRRSRDGSYSIAIMGSSVRYTERPFGSKEPHQGLYVFAVTALPDDSLLLVGVTGLYRLKGNELVQQLAFANAHQKLSDSSGKVVRRWTWKPSKVVVLDDGSYLISGAFGGIYQLSKGSDGQWSFTSLDEKPGDPVEW